MFILVFGFLFEVDGSDLISIEFYYIFEKLSIYWESTGSYTPSNKVARGTINACFLTRQLCFCVRAT